MKGSMVNLILLEEVPGLGNIGSQVLVKSGYARNFLLPQKLAAAVGTKEAQEVLAKLKVKKVAKEEQAKIKEAKKTEQEEKQKEVQEKKKKLLAKKLKK